MSSNTFFQILNKSEKHNIENFLALMLSNLTLAFKPLQKRFIV